jgi:hypothetical protein
MTWYNVGVGACGWKNKASDFVVAVNTAQFDSGAHCGQRIEIRANGKTAIAEVVDECPGCSHNGLDLSKSLFAHFESTDDGVFDASWNFLDHHQRETRDVVQVTGKVSPPSHRRPPELTYLFSSRSASPHQTRFHPIRVFPSASMTHA